MPDLQARFDWGVREIERAYADLGHRMGWRFLLTPRRTFARGAPTALLSFHPGGRAELAGQGKASCESGSAYLTESWHDYAPGAAPLQGQVRDLLQLFEAPPDDTLSAYFVPFRAPDWKSMIAPRESLEFARELWRTLLAELAPKVLLVLGADAFDELGKVIGQPDDEFERPAGWGAQKLVLARFGERLAIRIPQLSQFKLLSRPDGRAALEDAARRVDAFRQGSEAWRR